MKTYKTNAAKKFLLEAVFAIVTALFAMAGLLSPFGKVQTVHAAGEVTLIAEVSDVIAGQANPEFTVMFKFENNSGIIGGAQLVITPLDNNVKIGSPETNYVAGDTWLAANAGATIVNEKNINIIGTDDAGITKSSFSHGGYKFSYSGTPAGAIAFNVALISVYDENVEEVTVKFNNQVLTENYDLSNLSVTPRTVDTTNTLSGLTVFVGDKQVLSGTGDSQTIAEPIANAEKANVKISATRAGAASKIKVTEGDRTIVAEQAGDVSNVSLGDLSVGEHTITITVTSESGEAKAYTVKLTIAEPLATPIKKPTATGSTTGGYSGSPLDFTPSGMADLVSSGKVKLFSVSDTGAETPVGIDAFKPKNAGTYKIVARPEDGYTWEGDATDAEYNFTVNKAVLNAKKAEDGKLPTFTSDSYKGSLDNIVEFKYYSDAACTQEVAKSALKAGTKYYAKPALKAGAEENFEFDSDSVTQGYVDSGAEYEVPKAQGGEDDNKKGVPFWVWIIVAAIALIIIILLILWLMKRKKDDDDEDEHRVYGGNVAAAAALQTENATEKLEDRMHEMEREASEREITRYKEEAERAEKRADKNEANIAAQPMFATPNPTDAAAQERVKELEGRMHEMERDAHEREIARYKEEVERAEKRADKNEANIAAQPILTATPIAAREVTDTAAQERVKELEERMHEMERDAHEREIARYKEEIERAEKMADEAKREQSQSVPPFVQQPVLSDTDAKIEKLGEEMRRRDEELKKQMQSQAEAQRESEHKRETERLSALMNDAEKEAADLREKLKNAEQEKAFQEMKALHFTPASPQSKSSGMEDSEVDAETYAVLKAYEERLRSMEREMQERKMETMVREENERTKKEMEEAARMRRHEEEMQRLRELQQQEQLKRRETQQPYYGYNQYAQQPPQAIPVYPSAMDYQRRQQELEMQRLQLLEEQLKQKEIENRLLNEQLRQQYAAYPPYGYAAYPPYGTGNPPQSPVPPDNTKK